MRLKGSPSSIDSRLRFGLTLTIALAVISSSPVIVFDNLGLARPSPSSSSQSNAPTAPSTISQDGGGDVSIQAPLQIPRTLQSTDLVNSLAFYEVTFITSTTGAIDKIRMDFPAGTNIAAAGVIERVGIGGGTLLKSGSSITYDVTTPVSIPAGTFIRLEIFGIKNPTNPSTTFTAMITTRDSGGNLIDGPSSTNVYTIKQIGSNDVSEDLIKKVTLLDNAGGNVAGWNPDGVDTFFIIEEPDIVDIDNAFISIIVKDGLTPHFCDVSDFEANGFAVACSSAPDDGDSLHYVLEHLPPHVS
jgi:hypothetical protein